MTIKDIIQEIKTTAIGHMFVNNAEEGDVYECMNNGEKRYASVIITPDNILVTPETIEFSCNIFYIDRLLEGSENKLDIYAIATNTLQLIIKKIKSDAWNAGDYFLFDDYSINVFTEKFQDLCAGAYANVRFRLVNSINDCSAGIFTSKTISITANGNYSVTGYDKAAVNVPSPLPVLEELNVTANGTYLPSSGKDGFSKAVVNVPAVVPEMEELNVTANGTYNPSKDGYSKVTVNVPNPELEDITITSNGTYKSTKYGYDDVTVNIAYESEELNVTSNGTYNPSKDGYSKVTVNVPNPELEDISITANGTYKSTKYGYDDVIVNVPNPELEELNVSTNGTFNPAKYGYSKVTVNVPNPELEVISITENGTYNPTKYGYSKAVVNVQPELEELNVTENGTYNPTKYGYSKVTIDVAYILNVEFMDEDTYNGSEHNRKTLYNINDGITNNNIIKQYLGDTLVWTPATGSLYPNFIDADAVAEADPDYEGADPELIIEDFGDSLFDYKFQDFVEYDQLTDWGPYKLFRANAHLSNGFIIILCSIGTKPILQAREGYIAMDLIKYTERTFSYNGETFNLWYSPSNDYYEVTFNMLLSKEEE